VREQQSVFLLDVSETSRLRAAIHEAPVSPMFASMSKYEMGPPQSHVGSPRFDPATGDPVMPDRAAPVTGEFHLLSFDPTREPAVDDPWAQSRVVDMSRQAFDRRSSVESKKTTIRVMARLFEPINPDKFRPRHACSSANLLCRASFGPPSTSTAKR
jgi:hypothetical protein